MRRFLEILFYMKESIKERWKVQELKRQRIHFAYEKFFISKVYFVNIDQTTASIQTTLQLTHDLRATTFME